MGGVVRPKLGLAYPDEYLKMWQQLWGDRFLSPGGPEEVRRLVEDRGLGGRSVLDVGCGLGGPAAVLVQEMNVYSLVGIDFQANLIDSTNEWAAEIGLGDIAEFRHVESFTWPFPDSTFDVVFCKDSWFHVDDTMYWEIFRVLKPGGQVLIADWFSTDKARTPELSKWLEESTYAKVSMTVACVTDACTLSGFTNIEVEDRSERFRTVFRDDVENLRGEAGKQLEDDVGAEAVRELLSSWAEPCAALLEQGQLHLATICATKPSD